MHAPALKWAWKALTSFCRLSVLLAARAWLLAASSLLCARLCWCSRATTGSAGKLATLSLSRAGTLRAAGPAHACAPEMCRLACSGGSERRTGRQLLLQGVIELCLHLHQSRWLSNTMSNKMSRSCTSPAAF